MEEPQESSDVFSVNDWDIEKGIFNLVISLVQQKMIRMGPEAARISVINFLDSLKRGLEVEEENVEKKIEDFIHEQRKEENI